jgi:hypothetical protein
MASFNKKRSLDNVIIWLLQSEIVWLKVIPLSGTHFISNFKTVNKKLIFFIYFIKGSNNLFSLTLFEHLIKTFSKHKKS